jgi:hypothetical protein
MKGVKDIMGDLEYVLTFKKECRKCDEFFGMNPKAWAHVKELCQKHGWDYYAL